MDLQEYKKVWKKPLQKVSLCFLVNGDSILLGLKKRGFGAGKLNGVGGKLKGKESIEECSIRETHEEIGVVIKKMKKAGVIKFYTSDLSEADIFNQEVHIFVVSEWEGTPSESEEIRPAWFNKNELPFEKMWPDDPYWLPQVLAGKYVDAEILFDENEKPSDVRIVERAAE